MQRGFKGAAVQDGPAVGVDDAHADVAQARLDAQARAAVSAEVEHERGSGVDVRFAVWRAGLARGFGSLLGCAPPGLGGALVAA